jgi:hypothetical protein
MSNRRNHISEITSAVLLVPTDVCSCLLLNRSRYLAPDTRHLTVEVCNGYKIRGTESKTD